MTSLFWNAINAVILLGFSRCLFLCAIIFLFQRGTFKNLKIYSESAFFELLYFNIARIELFMHDPDWFESSFSNFILAELLWIPQDFLR